MSKLAKTLFAVSLFASPAAHAEESYQVLAAGASQAAQPLSEGEVRKVDREANKITIKHGPLVNLDMPGMTMVFQVRDPALLDRAKAGDKVKFRVEKEGAQYFVVSIDPVK